MKFFIFFLGLSIMLCQVTFLEASDIEKWISEQKEKDKQLDIFIKNEIEKNINPIFVAPLTKKERDAHDAEYELLTQDLRRNSFKRFFKRIFSCFFYEEASENTQ